MSVVAISYGNFRVEFGGGVGSDVVWNYFGEFQRQGAVGGGARSGDGSVGAVLCTERLLLGERVARGKVVAGGSVGSGGSGVGVSHGDVGDGDVGVGGRGTFGCVGGTSGKGTVVDSSGGDAGVVGVDAGGVADVVVEGRGPNWARNRVWREKKKNKKNNRGAQQGRSALHEVPEWRRGAVVGGASGVPSLSGSVRTVDTRTAEEIEAVRTLAARRVVENKVAIAKGEHALLSLADKEKTAALQRLAVVRVEERINTARARSQASYKKCGSEIESAGSAASAGEFALKQELRQKDALRKRYDYLERQMDEAMKYLSPAGKQAVAALPEPYIPTDAEIAEADEDVSPFKSYEEMQEDMRRYFAGEIL